MKWFTARRARLAIRCLLGALASSAVAAGPALAARHIYSYDSLTPLTVRMTETGLSFIFDKTLMNVRVERILETHDVGAADLRPASGSALGPGGLNAVLGPDAPEHDVYEITDQENGKALRHALCRGDDRVWLVFGRLKVGRDLRVHAVGRDPATGRAHLCETLDYGFHGEWLLPKAIQAQPDRSDRFNDAPNRLPY